MKNFLVAALMLLSVNAIGQVKNPVSGILNRFTDPDMGHVVFIEKGCYAVGVAGGYRSFNAIGEEAGDGYAIFSLLNIGQGQARMWNVSPKFSWFVANDVCIGGKINYSGYLVDTNINLDLRDALGGLFTPDDPSQPQPDLSDLNIPISHRHMLHQAGGLSIYARKYLSFFGSRTIGLFGEAAVLAKTGGTYSYPINDEDPTAPVKRRETASWGVGLNFCGGLAIRLRDNSSISVSIPIIGLAYNSTRQIQTMKNTQQTSAARVNSFDVSRKVNFMGIQFAYTHYIFPKKKR